MENDVLTSVILEKYPSLDTETINIVLSSFNTLEECAINLSLMGDVDFDKEIVLKTYSSKLESKNKIILEDLETNSKASPPLTPSSGLSDVENDVISTPPSSTTRLSDKPFGNQAKVQSTRSPGSPCKKSSAPSSSSVLKQSEISYDESKDESSKNSYLESIHRIIESDSNNCASEDDELDQVSTLVSDDKDTDVIPPPPPPHKALSKENNESIIPTECTTLKDKITRDTITSQPDTVNGNGRYYDGDDTDCQNSDESTTKSNDQSETEMESDNETFMQYFEFLQLSFPDLDSVIVKNALKENDCDPFRASDQLLNMDALSHELEKIERIETRELESQKSEDLDPVVFLTTSFPDIDKDIITEVYSANKEDLLRASDELLSLAAISSGDIRTDTCSSDDDLDPVAFLSMSFPESSLELIESALENNNNDILLASDELLSSVILRKYKEELQLLQHRENLEQAVLERKNEQNKFQQVRNRPAKKKAHQENINFLVENYGLDKGEARILYENSGSDLFLAVSSIMEKSKNAKPIKHARLLTTLDMKVQHASDFPPELPSTKATFSRSNTSASSSSQISHGSLTTNNSSRPVTGASSSTSSAEMQDVQMLVDQEQIARIEYVKKAAEAYRKAKSNPLYRSVAGHYMGMARQHAISNNARLSSRFDDIVMRQTTQYSIDLHHLSLSYALEAASLKLENWWISEEIEISRCRRPVHFLKIVTGAGTHSVDNIPRIKNGVRKMLVEGQWNFTEHRAHYDVYGKKRIK